MISTQQPHAAGHAHGARADRRARSVLGFTVLGTLVPGLGLIVAGWRRTGAVVLGAVVAVAVVLAVRVGRDPLGAVGSILGSGRLAAVEVLAPVVGLAWAVLVVLTHRALRPAGTPTGARVAMSGVVGLLCLGVLTPAVLVSQVAVTTRRTVDTIFANGESATRPDAVVTTGPDPWAGKPRLNVLVLGSDAGPTAGGGIRAGVRTDSIVVASIDTHTGNTVLVSVPRNLENLQFPPGSGLARAYPGGYATYPGVSSTDPRSGENLVNSVYRNVPAQHPGILGKTANEGADALKLGLGQSLGLRIDYYVLVSLTGFKQVVDALGGVTVNIDEPVAVGGSHDPTVLPIRFLMPGAAQHLSGYDAQWFARGRFNTDDNSRLRRQRCTINALTTQASAARLLLGYQSLADTAANVTLTDIPPSVLPALVRLGDTVRAHGTQSSLVVDTGGLPGLAPADPDWDRVRAAVQLALRRSAAPPPATAASPPASTSSRPSTAAPSPTPAPPAPTAAPTSTAGPQIQPDLSRTCGYDQALADRNLATWKASYGSQYDSAGNRR